MNSNDIDMKDKEINEIINKFSREIGIESARIQERLKIKNKNITLTAICLFVAQTIYINSADENELLESLIKMISGMVSDLINQNYIHFKNKELN